ncbi:EF-hand domain-containing protein [Methylomarinum sp. Ch1-1]|uniref:EF-hand domain-containing protein n=1 Tax=Methylomarinum roseum TaxID=3067653 RepID=A0AAU7NXU6_9GAMM|nr:EF-hand domain-containing protein [Methylomarinum sp. Ch1-1]MDP4522483.1 EF-hand domain-containing protein [Methylomarinum sp. Ch1-1]
MNKHLLACILLALTFAEGVIAEPDSGGKDINSADVLKRFDGNGDGVVSEAEFNGAMQQRYLSMDGNEDGDVSIDELKRYSIERLKNWRQKKHVKMDFDRDGVVSKQEFIDHAAKQAERRFNGLDKNQDGRLDQEEYGQAHLADKERLLESIDNNRDGAVDAEEHAELIGRWFEKLDSDGDKVISSDEWQGHLRAFKRR